MRITQLLQHSPRARTTPRLVGFAAVVCLLLLGVSTYDAIHVHGSVGPLESAPLATHHCLLCLAAHLPVTIGPSPALPVLHFTCAAPLPSNPLVCYESAATLPLSIRPPPAD